jgi:DNA-binding response OmpR family regulator
MAVGVEPAERAAKRFVALVVEDDQAARRAIAEYLRYRGVTVVEAGNAEEAKEALRFVRPSLAIIDVMMRGNPEGYEVCRAVKTASGGGETYVIMLTGLGEPTQIEKGKDAGADQYLVKPVMLAMLWEIIVRLGCLVA